MDKKDGRITDEAALLKARQLSEDFPELLVPKDFGFSRGWFSKFKKRNGFRSMLLHGEASSADMNGVERARETLAKVPLNFKQANEELVNFAPKNIFNMNENGLFW